MLRAPAEPVPTAASWIVGTSRLTRMLEAQGRRSCSPDSGFAAFAIAGSYSLPAAGTTTNVTGIEASVSRACPPGAEGVTFDWP